MLIQVRMEFFCSPWFSLGLDIILDASHCSFFSSLPLFLLSHGCSVYSLSCSVLSLGGKYLEGTTSTFFHQTMLYYHKYCLPLSLESQSNANKHFIPFVTVLPIWTVPGIWQVLKVWLWRMVKKYIFIADFVLKE